MNEIRQKIKTPSLDNEHQYMLNDIKDTILIVGKKLQDAESFYSLMECTTVDFLRGSEITQCDELIVSTEISRIYFKIQSVIENSTSKSRDLFNLHLMAYTNALACGKKLKELRRTIIPLFKRCLKESIDVLCQKYIISGN